MSRVAPTAVVLTLVLGVSATTIAASAAAASPSGTSAGAPTPPAGCHRARLPQGTSLVGARLYWTSGCTPFVRTPATRFARLPGFARKVHYSRVEGLRMAYLDEGPRTGQVVLMLHGEPSWGYLYRKMIPPLVAAGYRVIVPDLIGMGRSDKPVQFGDYTYLRHVRWVETFIADLRLRDVTAFVQDWGSLIGLRVIGDEPGRFARIVVANGALPVLPEGAEPVTLPSPPRPDDALAFSSVACDGPGSFCFDRWAVYALTATRFRASDVVDAGVVRHLSALERAAYDAPFPGRIFMTGARVFPSLINTVGEAPTNAAAAKVLDRWTKPFLTLWGARDPIFGRSTPYQAQLRDRVPGAGGQPHHTYPGAGHFVQEDAGPDLARRVRNFIAANPIRGR